MSIQKKCKDFTSENIKKMKDFLKIKGFQKASRDLSLNMIQRGKTEKLNSIVLPTIKYKEYLSSEDLKTSLVDPLRLMEPFVYATFIAMIFKAIISGVTLFAVGKIVILMFLIFLVVMCTATAFYSFIFSQERDNAISNTQQDNSPKSVEEETNSESFSETLDLITKETTKVEKKESTKKRKIRLQKEIKKIVNSQKAKDYKKRSSDNWNYTKIAEKIGSTRGTVSAYMEEMGIN